MFGEPVFTTAFITEAFIYSTFIRLLVKVLRFVEYLDDEVFGEED